MSQIMKASRLGDNIAGMEIDKLQLRRVLDGLDQAFTWSETKEGETYWADIWNRLDEIYRTETK